MSADLRRAGASRTITFSSRGGTNSAIFLTSHGRLVQQYEGAASAPTKYRPDFSQSANYETLSLTITSSRSTGAVIPDSITYSVAGVELAFNSSGACTTAGFQSIFRITSGKLQIIGNLVGIASGASFPITAKAMLGPGPDADFVTASIMAEISPYIEGQSDRVDIAPDDDNNFTITQKGQSIKIKAQVFTDGAYVPDADLNTKYDFTWEFLDWDATSGETWKPAPGAGNSYKLTVAEASVNTCTIFRVTVRRKGSSEVVGSMARSIFDGSDPYDVDLVPYRNDTGTGGTEVASNDFQLWDDLPDSAYIAFYPKFLIRGGSAVSDSSVSWDSAIVTDASGVTVSTIAPVTGLQGTQKCYRLTIADFKNIFGGVGQYKIYASGTLN